MKRLWARVLVLLALHLSCGVGWGAEWPIVVSHQLTGYEKGDDSVTLGYTLHVVNGGDKGISGLKLSVFPPPRLPGEIIVLDVGALDPNQSRDVSFQFRVPAAPPKGTMARQTLTLGGECRDSAGTLLEFPVTSYPGGAR